MARFAEGSARILVATTVIEVGVDVPEASVMVIEHAERFGLAQLHQLRGRIGRGTERSTCLLLYKAPLGETAKARLAILRETDDGFRIAEEDLRLRGEGDVLGTRQSGMPGFRLARLEVHGKLLERGARRRGARAQPRPAARSPRGAALRQLLYLFARDEAIRLLGRGMISGRPCSRRESIRLRARAQPSVASGSGPNRFGPAVPRVQYQMIRMIAADQRNERQQHPPAAAVEIVQPPYRRPQCSAGMWRDRTVRSITGMPITYR